MELKEYLEEYRAVTLDLMDKIQQDGQINSLIEEREFIIKKINNSNFNKEEIKVIGATLNLMELEEELQSIYKKEKVKVRKQIENVKRARVINENYNKLENMARVFNKSV